MKSRSVNRDGVMGGSGRFSSASLLVFKDNRVTGSDKKTINDIVP